LLRETFLLGGTLAVAFNFSANQAIQSAAIEVSVAMGLTAAAHCYVNVKA